MANNDVHVMPENDLKEHVFENCPCNPHIEMDGADLVYIHNSWDGREYVEQVEKILGIESEDA